MDVVPDLVAEEQPVAVDDIDPRKGKLAEKVTCEGCGKSVSVHCYKYSHRCKARGPDEPDPAPVPAPVPEPKRVSREEPGEFL